MAKEQNSEFDHVMMDRLGPMLIVLKICNKAVAVSFVVSNKLSINCIYLNEFHIKLRISSSPAHVQAQIIQNRILHLKLENICQ